VPVMFQNVRSCRYLVEEPFLLLDVEGVRREHFQRFTDIPSTRIRIS